MSGAIDIIRSVITIMGVGVTAQVLADWLRIPSVTFLIFGGVVVGPEGFGFITPAVFGDALPAIVGLSVAIIVFEGAFNLHLERIREAPQESFRLITIGVLLSLVGTAIVVRYVVGTPWNVAFLVGSLLVATGPTVITPIMNIVPVRERVATTLETEGVVNDVTAAILSIVMFEYVLLDSRDLATLVQEFAIRFGLGILVGGASAAVVWYILHHVNLSVENAPENARLIVLVASLTAYGIAEVQVSEAGIAAAATSGFVLGNTDIPYREDIERFKGDITLLVIAFVFVTLASLLSFDDILTLGIGGIIAVVAVAGVVRPAIVFLCTVGSRFTYQERLFISVIGPRGIIPASVATLFALELRPQNPTVATTLVGTVFLIVFATVVIEGGLARHLGQTLDVIPMRVIIIGGGRVGTALAERLEDRGEDVLIIESDERVVEELRQEGFTVLYGEGEQLDILENAGAYNAKVVAAATADDHINLLIGQLAKNTFNVETVVARVNEPGNLEAFDDLDIESIPSWLSIALSMDNIIERPAIARWMTERDREGDIQEVEVSADEVIGKTVLKLRTELPGECHIALISHNETNQLPHLDYSIEQGDYLTFIGRKEAVREAVEYCKT
ncbi:potassium transporter [halophilic archaeon]|nr:potassium transporter [halophilic archaeon]